MHGVKCLEGTCLGRMFGDLSWGESFGRMSEVKFVEKLSERAISLTNFYSCGKVWGKCPGCLDAMQD